MQVEILNEQYEWLFAAALLAIVLGLYAGWQRRRLRRRYAEAELWESLSESPARWRSIFSVLLTAGALALVAAALLDLRYGRALRDVPQRGIEVVFALDVSRSMLAEDATPNRLERAKQQISDLIDAMPGDRVALVIFAGEARQVVPLTSHHEDFTRTLAEVGPDSLPRGGSQLAAAIREARNAFLEKTNDHKAIVIFSDGEDQRGEPIEAAAAARREAGIRIFTVGLGDADRGARIPTDDGRSDPAPTYVRHKGKIVWSKMETETLQRIAEASNGAFIPAGTKRVAMDDVYQGYIADIDPKEFATAQINALVPRFQWFALPALVLLLIEIWISSGGRRPATGRRSPRGTIAGAIAATLLLGGGTAEAQVTASDRAAAQRYNQGVELYRQGQLAEAAEAFTAAAGAEAAELAARSRYNLGNCLYAQALAARDQQPEVATAQLEQAIGHYRGALRLREDLRDARVNLELAARLLQQLRQPSQPPPQQSDPQQPPESDATQPQQQPPENSSAADDAGEEDAKSREQPAEQPGETDSPGDDDQEQQSASEPTPENAATEQPDSGGRDSEDQEDSEAAAAGEQPQGGEGSSDSQEQAETAEAPQAAEDRPQGAPAENRPAEAEQPEEGQSAEAGTDPATSDAAEPVPRGELTAERTNPPSGEEPAAGSVVTEQVMTREEAEKLLQAVRDREMLRRLLERRRQRRGRVRVERDW
jgi:Ca-activated chloride channel family protein